MSHVFPFTAIVDQLPMKRALIYNAVNPEIRGVLLSGERGTAKSTAVRGLAEVLPNVEVVAECPFNCHPSETSRMCSECRDRYQRAGRLPSETRPMRVVDLPLNASIDRVVGTLDVEEAVAAGHRQFEPGVLADANRNLLYVDEVNLLDDHIVDVLLDAAAMGENIVEREGVSFRHPAEFILVGTMNPEEGELRPQLLDRFDLVVEVTASDEIEERAEITRRRAGFDTNPTGFQETYSEEQAALRERIAEAQDRLPEVSVDEELLAEVSLDAIKQRAHGVRADIAVNRIGRAIAAYEGETTVTQDHLAEAEYFAFPHRVEGAAEMEFGQGLLGDQSDDEEETEGEEDDDEAEGDDQAEQAGGIPIAEEGESYPVERTAIDPPQDRHLRDRLARQVPSKVELRSGRYVRARDREEVDDIALDATIRAAAPHQQDRQGPDDRGIRIEGRDFRQKVRQRQAEALVVFIVDGSGSVMSGRQMVETKRGILSLIEDAYRARNRVAVVVFRGEDAFILVEPTRNHRAARQAVSSLTVGGNTPLAHGLVRGYELIQRERRRTDNLYPLAVVFSDGQTNVPYREDGDAKRDAFEAAALFDDADIPSVYLDTGYQIDTTPDEIWTDRKAERIKRKRLERNLEYADTLGGGYLPLISLPRNTTLPEDVEVSAV